VRATWARTNFGSYLEQLAAGPGNGLGLSVQGRSSESLQSVLGAKLDLAASTSWGVVMPHTEMEWVHEFRASPDRLNASFLQDPTATPFQLQGDAIDTDYFKFGMGMSFVFPHGRSGFFYVERTLGLSGLTQANISAGFRMEF
jgi:outer membrane autotransporter protein